jgi:glutathione peroxidase-family protein
MILTPNDQPSNSDPYEDILFRGYTDEQIAEIKKLMETWDQATYPTLAYSIVDHADRHDFQNEYLKYLRKAANFNKRGARKKNLLDGAIRWNKGFEFLIERNGKIISYGENK